MIENMKKNLWIKLGVLSVVLIFLFVGCGSSKENTDMQANKDMQAKTEEMVKDNNTEEMDKSKKELLAGATCENQEAATETVSTQNEGELANEFEFVDMDGNIVNNETLKGQKVYLKYWASWCSICLAGLQEVDDLSVMDKDYTVYTVVTPNANGEQSQEDFVEWFAGLEQKNIKVLFDMKGQAASEFGVRAFPTSIFLGSDGVLVQVSVGHKSNEDINEFMESFY